MVSAPAFVLTTALFSLIASTSAGYSAASKNNVAIYYGQGPNEVGLGLHDFCLNSPGVDIIPLGFLDIYPAQGNGWPGTNFASSCGSTNFAAPGYNNVNDPSKNDLKDSCPSLVDGIAFCQSQNKQILLSLGGAPGTTPYRLTSTADAEYLADFLWGAFGPLQSPNTWPRPFDTATASNSVDGFDFDIEVIQPGEQQFYITMINKLIGHFPKGAGAKKYLITGAPQCIVPDHQMGDMISAVPFDILFVQYYNTDACSARSWKTANPQYPSVPENPSSFSYEFDQLLTFLDMGASKNAKIFFGVPGAAGAASANQYLTPAEVTPFLEAYYCQPRFGGVMVWEGIYANDNNMFQNTMKDLLIADSQNAALKKCPTTPPPCCTKPYTIASGDFCSKIYTAAGLNPDQFYALNPSLGPKGVLCNYLQPGQTLCLARASSTTAVCSVASVTKTTSTTSAAPTATQCVTCTQYYTVKPGDYCYLIQTQHTTLTSNEFYALNPVFQNGTNCNLQPGDKCCIAGSVGACPTTSTTSTTSSSKTSSTITTTTKSTTTTSSTTSTAKSSSSISSSTTSSSSTSSTSSSTKSSTTSSSSTSSTSSSTKSSTTSSSSTSSSSSSTKSSTTSSSSTSSTSSSTKSSTTTSSSTSSTSSSTKSSATSSSVTSSSSSSTKSSTTTSSTAASTPSSSSSSSSSSSRSSSITSSSSSSSYSSASITSATSSSTSRSSSSSISSTTSSSIVSSTSSASLTTSSSSTSSSSSSSISSTSLSNSTTSSATSSSSATSAASPVTYTKTTSSVYTVTSCPPTVTNCPLGHVTTDIIKITTTYCPANATSAHTATPSPVQYTTSLVYTTLTYTITACPATVTNCPAKIGSVTTETKLLYTTICPVSAIATPLVVPASTVPGPPAKEVSNPTLSIPISASLEFSPSKYSTVGVPKASSSSSSFAVLYQTTSVMPVAQTTPSKSVVASASPVKPGSATFTGGAANMASLGVGGIMAVVLCMVGWALV